MTSIYLFCCKSQTQTTDPPGKGSGFETTLIWLVHIFELAIFSLQFLQEGASTPILTDDVSLQVFMEHLKKLAVSSST